MCLIVDANCFGTVFDPKSTNHDRFVPVYDWILYGNGGRLIYGGKKYKKEVNFRTSHFRRLLTEFERRGRLRPLSDKAVDEMAAEIKAKVNNKDFDDEHIVALVAISKCCVVCTLDKIPLPSSSALYFGSDRI